MELLDYIVLLYFFEESYTIFHSGYTNLQFPKECTGDSFSLHPPQYLLFLVFFDRSHSSGYEVLSLCGFYLHSMMISNVEHLFMLAICASLKKCLFGSPAYF